MGIFKDRRAMKLHKIGPPDQLIFSSVPTSESGAHMASALWQDLLVFEAVGSVARTLEPDSKGNETEYA